ncbi:dCTP deaminase [Xanthomonas phage RTH11]|nr:dCTP deaminase [Xanthomonas phage RTH11]
MGILADHQILKLCDLGPIITYAAMREEMEKDEQLLAEIKAHVAAQPNKNHPKFFEAAEMSNRIHDRWRTQPFGMIHPFNANLIREVIDEGSEHRQNAAIANWARANPTEVPSQELQAEFREKFPLQSRKIVSKGLTSYGYDVSLSDRVKLFTNINSATIDPKRFNEEESLVDAVVKTDPCDGSQYVMLPPNSYLLGVTNEYFRIPRNVMVICLGKSTYARCGAIVNATPIEPGFHGNVVIEISNSTPSPMRIYVNEGIAQFLFFEGEECQTSYADRGGKYQGQTGVTLPKV